MISPLDLEKSERERIKRETDPLEIAFNEWEKKKGLRHYSNRRTFFMIVEELRKQFDLHAKNPMEL